MFCSSASECEVFSLKIFALKWIFVLACCFRQTSKRHLLLWLTDGGDALDDESPSIKKRRRLAFSPCTNSIFIKTLDATTVSILFLASNLPLLLQLDSCSGLLRMSFWRFFSCSATLLSKISTPLETCVGQKLILIQMRPTCYSPVLSFMYIFFIICLQKHARSFARVCKLQCACRESNPGHKRGRLVCCRYTTGALVHEIFLDLLVLFSFLKALRANPLMGLPLTSCILLFVSHCQVTSNPGSLFHLHLSIGCLV